MHHFSHDEVNTAEYAWILAKRLNLLALIPRFTKSSNIHKLVLNIKDKNIIELGGITKKSLELDARDINHLRLMYLYFKNCRIKCSIPSFSSKLASILFDIRYINDYIRIEIPFKYRKTAKNSYNFYVILENIINILTKLKLPDLKCRICENIIHPLPDELVLGDEDSILSRGFRICIRCLDSLNSNRLIMRFLQVLKENKLFATASLKNIDKLAMKCILCGKYSLSAVCSRHGLYLSSILKPLCLEEKDLFKISIPKHVREYVSLDNPDIELKRGSCIDCYKQIIFSYGNSMARKNLCSRCYEKYDWTEIRDEIMAGKFKLNDFFNLTLLRAQYRRSD